MISQTVEYALRAVVCLANEHPKPCTTQQIAKVTMVPGAYLSKVMQSLVRSQLLKSQRGRRGGFVLMRPPEELTIWDVIDSVEPFKRIRECPLGMRGHGTNLCPLHRRLDDSMAEAEHIFRTSTINSLLAGASGVTPLCEVVENGEEKVHQIEFNGLPGQ